jgi:hypothetical protein
MSSSARCGCKALRAAWPYSHCGMISTRSPVVAGASFGVTMGAIIAPLGFTEFTLLSSHDYSREGHTSVPSFIARYSK